MIRATTTTTSVFFLVCLGAATTRAEKDNSYYMANNGNPNIDREMYWKNAENVLQDLSKFSYLYVEFHQCVWSWMQYSETSDDIDENDYWYMGSVPAMGANVAYSLYGALSGHSWRGCTQNSFINSFYTNNGFQDFSEAMTRAGLSGFYDDGYLTSQCQGSYGVGCDYSNGFSVHTYDTDECNPRNFSGVADKLSNLNYAMGNASCIKIYDKYASKRSSSYGYSSNNDDYYYDYDNGNFSYSSVIFGSPLELLFNSTACNYMNMYSPDGDCPDPYGVISTYVKSYEQGIEKKEREDPFLAYEIDKAKSIKQIFFGSVVGLVGIILVLLDTFIVYYSTMVGFLTRLSKRCCSAIGNCLARLLIFSLECCAVGIYVTNKCYTTGMSVTKKCCTTGMSVTKKSCKTGMSVAHKCLEEKLAKKKSDDDRTVPDSSCEDEYFLYDDEKAESTPRGDSNEHQNDDDKQDNHIDIDDNDYGQNQSNSHEQNNYSILDGNNNSEDSKANNYDFGKVSSDPIVGETGTIGDEEDDESNKDGSGGVGDAIIGENGYREEEDTASDNDGSGGGIGDDGENGNSCDTNENVIV